MTTRHLVDPELYPLLDLVPTIDVDAANLEALRALALPVSIEPGAEALVEKRTRRVPGPPASPDVDVTILTPRGRPAGRPCIFHIHGGGFVAGSVASMDAAHRFLASELQCAVVAVEYRLAPETKFPGAIEDCYAALQWTFENAAELGIDDRRIGVMGESAGGGLAAALALLVRDRRRSRLAFQHLIYPMLDDRTCVTASPHPYAGEFIWTPISNAFGWSALLGCPPGSPDVSPYAAPARAVDLGALPPTFIATGALDLFLEEDLEYARRLTRSGVPVELHVYPGAYHGFDLELSPTARVAQAARRDSLDALGRAMAPPIPGRAPL